MKATATYFFPDDWGTIQAAYEAGRAFFVAEAQRIGQPSIGVIAYPGGNRMIDEDQASRPSLRTTSNTVELIPTIVPNKQHPDTERRLAWVVRNFYFRDLHETYRLTPGGYADFDQYRNRR